MLFKFRNLVFEFKLSACMVNIPLMFLSVRFSSLNWMQWKFCFEYDLKLEFLISKKDLKGHFDDQGVWGFKISKKNKDVLFESPLNPPMPDSKSAQSWYFFSILEISNFLGFQNVFPKLYEPSWFWIFFVFSWNSLFFCASLHATHFAKNWCKTKWPCFS